jgi:hypothetical protein
MVPSDVGLILESIMSLRRWNPPTNQYPNSNPRLLLACDYPKYYNARFHMPLHQQAWSSGYDFCLTTQVFGYTEGSEFDSQGL